MQPSEGATWKEKKKGCDLKKQPRCVGGAGCAEGIKNAPGSLFVSGDEILSLKKEKKQQVDWDFRVLTHKVVAGFVPQLNKTRVLCKKWM